MYNIRAKNADGKQGKGGEINEGNAWKSIVEEFFNQHFMTFSRKVNIDTHANYVLAHI